MVEAMTELLEEIERQERKLREARRQVLRSRAKVKSLRADLGGNDKEHIDASSLVIGFEKT